MALSQLDRPDGITCPKYQKLPDYKRCQHFVDGGTCALPDELLCIEWVKHNPERAKGYQHEALPGVEDVPQPKDQKQKPAPPDPASTSTPVHAQPQTVSLSQLVSDDDIESLASLGLELCVEGWGDHDFWLVPKRTSADRVELTYRDAAALANTLVAFPGSRVTQIRKASQ